MNNNPTNKKLLPKLRFPEFEGDGEWEVEIFHKVYNFKSSVPLSRDKLNYDFGNVKNIHYGDIHTKFSTLFDIVKENVPYINKDISIKRIDKENYCIKGDMVFADASEDVEDIGKSIEIININNEELIAGLHTFLARQIEKKIILGFGGYLFKSEYIRTQIKRESQGAKVLGISKRRLSNIYLSYPNKPIEQQKIADCLNSLDETIEAANEKLNLLKEHKKGLLQQLFPAAGEKVPKLRFPEFKNDGDWEVTTLEEVADYENGKAHEKEISTNGEYKVVNSKFISTDGEVVKFTDSVNLLAKIGDILMVLSDIPNGKAIAKCFYVDIDNTYTVNQRICKITPSNINNRFLFYLQNRNPYFLAFDDGVKQTNLRKDTVLSFPFLKPKEPKEQQKIADCLTLIDNKIEAQANKIEVLKLHKKGLMQQLFPTLNEE